MIKVDERNLPALAFGDSDELSAGQLVLAFGSPLGLHNSVSLGVVSAVARQLEPESPMIYVQTDASINPGSSGGPLVDVRGRLVGINTLIARQAGGNEGLGFAAPSNIVRTVYEQIRKSGRVRRGDIGIRAQTVTPVLAPGLGLPRDHGVVLADVLPGQSGRASRAASRRPGARARRQADGERPAAAGQPLSPLRRRRRRRSEVLRDGQSPEGAGDDGRAAGPARRPAGVDRSAPEPGAAAGHSRRDSGPADRGDAAGRFECHPASSSPRRSPARSIREKAGWRRATSSTRSTARVSPGSRSCARRSMD